MEIPIKLELIMPTMDDFIQKLQDFDSSMKPENKSQKIREILISVEDLRSSLINSYSSNDVMSETLFCNQIERIFNEFNWDINYTIKPHEFLKIISCCKSLVSSIMKMMGKRNCGIMIVELYFKMSIKLVNELCQIMEKTDNSLQHLLHFQLLVKGFLTSVKVLKKHWYTILHQDQKQSVMLCLGQSFKTLVFLGKIINERHHHLIKYLMNRLKQCFDKIMEVLLDEGGNEGNSEFIILMDTCLHKLDQLSCDVNLQKSESEGLTQAISSLKHFVDELLCHAMTISHIASTESDSIKACSQKVLDEMVSLNDANGNETGSDVITRAERLSDALCRLEEIVNDAVLNVVLDVFADVNDPLRNFVKKCDVGSGAPRDRTADDLEEEITAFDEHMDKIMHIGLFAVSCSTDVKKILGIRSCLASLESLEAELITSIVSLYLHPNAETKAVFQFIFRNWLEEITEMKTLMDLILDPAAFCKVVERRISAIVNELGGDDSVSESNIECNLRRILTFTKKLIKTLSRSVQADEEKDADETKKLIENLQLAFQEFEASTNLLHEELPMKTISDRIVKRAVLIISCIHTLNQHFIHINSQSFHTNLETGEQPSSKIAEIGAAGGSDESAAPTDSNRDVDVEALTPYINKGMLRTKERTILYNTPKNTQHFQNKQRVTDLPVAVGVESWWNSPLSSRSRARCCRPLPRNLELENSLDLELTLLLDNMSSLSDTFSSTLRDYGKEGAVRRDEWVAGEGGGNGEEEEVPDDPRPGRELTSQPDSDPSEKSEKIFLGTLMRETLDRSLSELSNSASLSIDGDSSSRYLTPERMEDLTRVQQKINFLLEHMNV